MLHSFTAEKQFRCIAPLIIANQVYMGVLQNLGWTEQVAASLSAPF